MQKLIIVIDGKESTKYKYNLWRCFEYEDGSISQDSRVLYTDSLKEFLKDLEEFIGEK